MSEIEEVSKEDISKYVDKNSLVQSNLTELNKKRYIAWVLYDIANTFYASGILTIIGLTWVLVIGQQNGYSYGQSNFFYNLTITISSVIMAVMLPILGSLSDVKQQRKNYVLYFTAICIFSTALFALFNQLILVLLLFAISMISYQWSQVFYDAMLPGIAPPGKEARLSSIAIALGYIGGFIVGIAGFYFQSIFPDPNGNPNSGPVQLGYYPVMIVLVIIGFSFLSIPLYFVEETNWSQIRKLVLMNKANLDPDKHDLNDIDKSRLDDDEKQLLKEELKKKQDNPVDENEASSFGKIAYQALVELWNSFVDIYNNNIGMFYYVIAYFIIADLANIITLINVTYMRDGLGLSDDSILTILGLAAGSLMVFSYPIGMICDKYGAKRGFQVDAILWTLALSILLLEEILIPLWTVFITPFLLGPALGGVWISQRQMVLELVPNEESVGRYFGMTKFSGKLSSAIGPLIFGFTILFFRDQLGSTIKIAYKWGIFVITILMIIGFGLLQWKVPNKHEEFIERQSEMEKSLRT